MRVLDVVKKQLSVLLVLIIIGEWFNPYICLANESKDEFDDELKAHSINLIGHFLLACIHVLCYNILWI